MVFHISYDLNTPGKAYNNLFDAIKALGSWCHPVESTWYVDTEKTATEIRDALMAVVDSSDQIIVSTAGGPWASFNLSNDVNQWFSSHM